MRVLLPLLAAAVLLSGCGSSCEELSDRICSCRPAGSSREGCRRAADERLDGADYFQCKLGLDRCAVPAGRSVDFCEWLTTTEGKEACGLAWPGE